MAIDVLNFERATINAARRALNTILRKAKTQTSKDIRKRYNIKARDLNKRIRTINATNRNLQAVLLIKSGKIPVYYFGAKQTDKGVFARIFRNKPRTFYKGAFIAPYANQNPEDEQDLSVFYRASLARQNKSNWKNKLVKEKPRRVYHGLPIVKQVNVSAVQMFNTAAESNIVTLVQSELKKEYNKELKFYLKRGSGQRRRVLTG